MLASSGEVLLDSFSGMPGQLFQQPLASWLGLSHEVVQTNELKAALFSSDQSWVAVRAPGVLCQNLEELPPIINALISGLLLNKASLERVDIAPPDRCSRQHSRPARNLEIMMQCETGPWPTKPRTMSKRPTTVSKPSSSILLKKRGSPADP